MAGDVFRRQLDVLLLEAIRARPAHGYVIIEELRRRSGGRIEVADGTLYPALYRLEAEGLVESEWDTSSDRRRRVYRLTRRGHRALRERRAAWVRLAAGVNAVLGEDG